MNPASAEKFRRKFQATITQFCQIFNINRDQFKALLGIETTKNLPDFEMESIIKRMEKTIESNLSKLENKVESLKMFWIKTLANIKLAFKTKQRVFSNSEVQFMALKRTSYQTNYKYKTLIIYSKRRS